MGGVDVSAGYSRDHINYKERRVPWRANAWDSVGTVALKLTPRRLEPSKHTAMNSR